MVIDQFEAWLVELGSCVGLCDRKTNGVCKTLTEGASSNFDTRCILSFGVTRGDTIYCLCCRVGSAATARTIGTKLEKTYSEGLQIVQRHLVAEEM